MNPVRSHRGRAAVGFTLVELLVVIGIIALLIGILMPALSKAQAQAKLTVCASNVRQLTLAYLAYATENNGFLVGGGTDATAPGTPGNGHWVGLDPGPPRTLRGRGALWTYLKKEDVYKCPMDAREEYIWSYAIIDIASSGGWSGGNKKISQLGPADRQAVFIEDADDRGSVAGSFVMQLNPDGWIDAPGRYHRNKGRCNSNLGFCDGHVENWKYRDIRTQEIFSDGNNGYPVRIQPDNPDLAYFKTVYRAARQ